MTRLLPERLWRFFSATAALGAAAFFGGGDLLAQTTPASQPSICNRSCWNAMSANLAPTTGLNRAIIHHTAGTYGNQSLNHSKGVVAGIQAYQMNSLGWMDIGYHFMTDALGNIFEARRGSMVSGTYRRGAHDSVNASSYGFSALGNYQNNTFTTAGRNAMWDVIAWRMPGGWSPYGSGSYGGKTVGRTDGHLSVKATACPGTNIWSTIGTNYNGGTARNAIATRRTPSPPPPPPPPPEPELYSVFRGGPDIFWYGPGSDPDRLWLGNPDPESGTNGSFITMPQSTVNVSGTYIPIPGDFNGNGKTDILWYGPGSDYDTLWLGKLEPESGTNGRFTGQQPVVINGHYIPIAGDFNGNGRTDIFWYGPGPDNPSTLWRGRATDKGGDNGWFNTGISVEVNGTYIPIVGDFNGDGADDIFWYGPGSDPDRLWLGRLDPQSGTNGAFDRLPQSAVNVSGNYIPIAGDFNGNGRTDIFWYGPGPDNPSTLWRGRATDKGGTNGWFDGGISVEINGTYIPIVGDFNFDGADDIFWYGPGTDPDRLWRGKLNPQSGTNGAFDAMPQSAVEINGVYVPFSGSF